MYIANLSTRSRLVLLLPLLAMACSRGPGEVAIPEAAILEYIPADTPYVLAALQSAPDEVAAKLGAGSVRVAKAYAGVVKAALDQPPAEGQEPLLGPEGRERVRAVIDELVALVTPEGMPAAGIDRSSTAAIYGVGLLPVLRVTLSDPAKFEAVFERIEERAGKAMTVASVDGHAYRYAGDGDARVIVAVLDGQLVVTLVPASLDEELLKLVLGITRPQQALSDSGELAELAQTYDFTPYGLGLIDVRRLAATFLDEQSGVNAALLSMMEHDRSALSDVCREEMRTIAGVVPRIVTGYTEMSEDRIRANSVFELRRDLAQGLGKVTAPVPGLGQLQEGLLAFGMSFDLKALREFYAARLDAMEADPFECELLEDLQAQVTSGREALQSPLPPFASQFQGFLAVINDLKGLDIARKQPPTEVDMRLLISTSNAQGLMAMGAMFLPQIASLDIKPDSKPVRVELPPTGAPVDAAWIAMSDDAIVLSVGETADSGLADMLAAKPAEPPPFLSMSMDAARYYGFLGEAMLAAEADAGEPSTEVAAATSELMMALHEMFDRISFDVQFTERGVELPQTMVLAP